ARQLAGVRVAAVGRATADALRRRGVAADLVPAKANSEALLAEFPGPPVDGARVLLPQADRARPELAAGLAALGWPIEAVEAYRTVPVAVPPSLLERALDADAICFTSGSTVDSWVVAAGPATPPVVASIGPVTTAAILRHGLQVTVEADEANVAALVARLADHLGSVGRTSSGQPTAAPNPAPRVAG
ncbi:MAG: uroporphyrinogen-III synthase, partial [Acidimicrobiales bacterium]